LPENEKPPAVRVDVYLCFQMIFGKNGQFEFLMSFVTIVFVDELMLEYII